MPVMAELLQETELLVKEIQFLQLPHPAGDVALGQLMVWVGEKLVGG